MYMHVVQCIIHVPQWAIQYYCVCAQRNFCSQHSAPLSIVTQTHYNNTSDSVHANFCIVKVYVQICQKMIPRTFLAIYMYVSLSLSLSFSPPPPNRWRDRMQHALHNRVFHVIVMVLVCLDTLIVMLELLLDGGALSKSNAQSYIASKLYRFASTIMLKCDCKYRTRALLGACAYISIVRDHALI